MSDELLILAKNYISSKNQWEAAVRQKIRNSPVMENKTHFWSIMDIFRALIFNHKKRDAKIKFASEEIVRQSWVEAKEFTTEDLASFICSYGKLKNQLDKRLRGNISRTGDYLTSLVDNLPLAGKEVCVTLLRNPEMQFEEAFNSISAAAYYFPELDEIILLDENYIEETLEDEYCQKLASILTRENN